jgi:hypothetical protein
MILIEYPFSIPSMRTQTIRLWESLVDPDTGALVPALPLEELTVPAAVELRSGELWFTPAAGRPRVRPPANLLEQFLTARTDAALIRFARRFGPLGTTKGGWLETQYKGYRESLDVWRRYQWEFNHLLSIAAALREGSSIETDPYTAFEDHGIPIPVQRFSLLGDLGKPWPPPWKTRTRIQRQVLASSLLLTRSAALVRLCELRPALKETRTDERRFDIVFQDGPHGYGMSLRGALTTQVLAAVTASGFTLCSACGRVFVPKRRQPAFGKRRFCGSCGRAAALRAAKAAFRKRQRERRHKHEGVGGK